MSRNLSYRVWDNEKRELEIIGNIHENKETIKWKN